MNTSETVRIGNKEYTLESLTLPTSQRKFRDAWEAPVSGTIQINLSKAKVIRAEQLKAELYERHGRLGGPFRSVVPATEKALITGETLSHPLIDAATSVEELEAITLDSLLV